MQMNPIILLGLAMLAWAFFHSPEGSRPAWSRGLGNWRKLIGIVAFVLAVLIIMNPEFMALGLFGDTAFFDLLVLLLSLQLQGFITRAWHCVQAVFSGMMRVMMPRPSLIGPAFILLFAPVGDLAAAIQKNAHRIFY
jgi:hypothetical protein